MILASNKIVAFCAAGVVLVGGLWTLSSIVSANHPVPAAPSVHQASEKTPGAKPAIDPRLPTTIGLPQAVRNNMVAALYSGNGRDLLRIQAKNLTDSPLRVVVPDGMIFRAGRTAVATVRELRIDLAPRSELIAVGATAALSSANVVAEAGYEMTPEEDIRLGPLLAHLRQHAEFTNGAVQTAVLAITENLPLRAFAKFAPPIADVAVKVDTTPFRVDTVEIVQALRLLRAIGIPNEHLALTIDPQLKIEAMIDPMAHATAMKYYGIRDEWAYWKGELTSGDASTRHYALYGIARFFPDVALKMLPAWVRETRTDPVYRISAVQALGETHKIEAVSTLRQIAHDLGENTEIGKTAVIAADYVEANLNKPFVPVVPFRLTRLPEPLPNPLLDTIPAFAVAN